MRALLTRQPIAKRRARSPERRWAPAQGCTAGSLTGSEIVGVDGNGYAPFAHRSDLLDIVRLNAGLDGDPSLDYDWDTVVSYLERYDRGQAINVGILVGNSALRIGAIGWDDEPADERALDGMRAMLREAMEAGAFGRRGHLRVIPPA